MSDGGNRQIGVYLLSAALASSSDGIVIADARQPDCPLIYVNAAFERMTGYPAAEVVGRNCRFLQGPDTDQAPLSTLRDALCRQQECTVVLRNYRKDGSAFWNELHIAPIRRDGAVTHYIGVQTDVTRRVEAERRAAELMEDLRRYNRHLNELVREKVREISDSQMATIFALARLAESRDKETGDHIERVQYYCRLLAETLRDGGYEGIDDDFVESIYRASPLHDIGKVGIPDAILLKPAKLDDDEFREMKRHTTIGADTLAAVREKYPDNTFISVGIEIARSHHERWCGGGYPEDLRGHDIPLAARIMALADVYDALRSARHYKDAFSHEKTRRIILEGRGKQFDPDVVDAFLAAEDAFRRRRECT